MEIKNNTDMTNTTETSKGININVTVLDEKRKELDTKLRALTKACKKFKLGEPVINIGDTYSAIKTFHRTEYDMSTGGKHEVPYEVELDLFDVSVSVEGMFKLNGDYTLEAIIDNETGFHNVVDIENEVPVEHLEVNNHCDHCGHDRKRTHTFILKDGEGDYKRVGRSCLKSFIGLNPTSFISALSFLNEFKEEVQGSFKFKNSTPKPLNHVFNRDKMISAIKNIIDADGGYVKSTYHINEDSWGRYEDKRRRENIGESTTDKAMVLYENNKNVDDIIEVNTEFVSAIDSYLESLNTKPETFSRTEWVDGEKVTYEFEKSNDFQIMAKSFLGRKKVRLSELYSLCGVVSGFLKFQEKQAELATKKESEWKGNVGDKIKVEATITDLKTGHGQYGTWFLWTMVDDNGNIFKKFGTISDRFVTEGDGVEKGSKVAFTAEVKEHQTYQDVKSTMLGRLSKF